MNSNREIEEAIKRLKEIANELDDEVLWGTDFAEEIDKVVEVLEKHLLHREEEP